MKNKKDADIWVYLNKKSKDIENKFDILTKRRTGSYYTDMQLTDAMMENLVECLKKSNKSKRLCEYSFLDPCVGAGNFVFSYIKAVLKRGITKEEANIMLNNVYVADVNVEAIKGYKESLKKLSWLLWEIKLTSDYFEKHISSGLLVNVTHDKLKYISINNMFKNMSNWFDIVATNPPYKNLKAEQGQYKNNQDYEKDKNKYTEISKIVKNNFIYSNDGVLNLYKLFVEEIIDKYANENAFISLLIPVSIMSDKTCVKLRTHILEDNKLLSVKVIGENNKFIDARQSLCEILIKKVYEQLVQAYKVAIQKKYITENIMNYISKPKSSKEVKEVQALEISVQKNFTDYLMNVSIEEERFKNIFLIQMYMGLRIGEVLALSSNDIDLDNNLMYIRRTLTIDKNFNVIIGNKTKTFSGKREIPIPKFLKTIIIEQLQYINLNVENLLFTLGNELIKTASVNEDLKRIFKEKLNIEDIGISSHCLRHTYGTRSIEAGMTAVVLQRLMGHKDVKVTLNTYTSVFNKFKQEELDKVSDYFKQNEFKLKL